MAKKKQTREELAFPLATIPDLNKPSQPSAKPSVIKQIIRGAIQGAYSMKMPSEPNKYSPEYGKKQKPIVSEDQVALITSLVEALQPTNVIEVALAAQFAIAHTRGQSAATTSGQNSMLELFRFSHEVLEAFQKFRTKGAQLINVQYNHNQGQIFNIKNSKEDLSPPTIEVC